MAKIRVSLKKKNPNGSGLIDIVSQNTLSSIIEHNGISIDEEKLQGIDNFSISERRANCTIKRIHNMPAVDRIIDEITNKNNLIQDLFDKEDMFTTSHVCKFSGKALLEKTSDDVLFRRKLEDSLETNLASKLFVVQSQEFYDIVYTAFMDTMSYPKGNTIPYPSIHKTYKIDNIEFNVTAYQLLAFFAKICLDSYGSTNVSSLGQAKTATIDYFNNMATGLGDTIEGYLNSVVLESDGIFTEYYNFSYLYIPFYRSTNASINTMYGIINEIMLFLGGVNFKVLMPGHTVAMDLPIGDSVDTICRQAAIFFSSMLPYDKFYSIRSDLALANGDDSSMRLDFHPLKGVSYVPFYHSIEAVRRYVGGVYKNIFWDSELATQDIISVLPDKLYGINDKIMLGKPQKMTSEETTEQNIPVNLIIPNGLQEEFDNEDLFVPVSRSYYPKESPFFNNISLIPYYGEHIIDDVNVSEIYSEPNDSFFYMTQYVNTNWMYFDNFECRESYSPNNGRVDNIPVFFPNNQNLVDTFGSYIYDDYYQNYYTVEPSNLMDIVIEIYKNNTKIYSGLVDFSSVKITRQTIEFSATDAVGLLIENLRKMNKVVTFSQFDKFNNLAADTRAGSTIQDFLNTIIYQPFPYRPSHGFKSFNVFGTDNSFLRNKVLEEISTEDAFVAGIQSSKKLLRCDGNGVISIHDIDFDSASYTNILEENIVSTSYVQSIENDAFNPEKIKKIAGHSLYAPEISSKYLMFRNKIKNSINITVVGNNNIKVLDKIKALNKFGIVVQVKDDIFRNRKEITAIGV